jgi:hypothetical protein
VRKDAFDDKDKRKIPCNYAGGGLNQFAIRFFAHSQLRFVLAPAASESALAEPKKRASGDLDLGIKTRCLSCWGLKPPKFVNQY